MDMINSNTRVEPKVDPAKFPALLHYRWYTVGWIHTFHIVYTKFWSCHLNVRKKISTGRVLLIFYSFFCFGKPQFSVLSRQERHPLCSSAVGHLLHHLTCCAYRDALFLTVVELLLPCYRLEAVWGFTSDLWQNIFTQRTAAHWIYSLFNTDLCKP